MVVEAGKKQTNKQNNQQENLLFIEDGPYRLELIIYVSH